MDNKTAKMHIYKLGILRQYFHFFSALTSVLTVVHYVTEVGVLKELILAQGDIAYTVIALIVGFSVFEFERRISHFLSFVADCIIYKKEDKALTFAMRSVAVVLVLLTGLLSYYGFANTGYSQAGLSRDFEELETTGEALFQKEATLNAAYKAQDVQMKDSLSSPDYLRYQRDKTHEIKQNLKPLKETFELRKQYAEAKFTGVKGIVTAFSSLAFLCSVLSLIVAYIQAKSTKLYVSGKRTVAEVIAEVKSERFSNRLLARLFPPVPKDDLEEIPLEEEEDERRPPKQDEAEEEPLEDETIAKLRKALVDRTSTDPETAKEGNIAYVEASEELKQRGVKFEVKGTDLII